LKVIIFAALKAAAAIFGWSRSYLAYYESFIKHINPALQKGVSYGGYLSAKITFK
jgi:hypothetical protein